MYIQKFQKQLRKKQTDAERRLWYLLRNRQLKGYKFRRQFRIGIYIVDFVCLSEKLVIECDGGQHNRESDKNHDHRRTCYLNNEGFQVLRFWNNDIMTNINAVLMQIEHVLSPLTRQN